MTRSLVLALALALSGCSVLGSRPVTVACQVADTVSTVKVIHAGGMEAGFFAGANASFMIGVGVVWLAVKLILHDRLDDSTRTVLNVIACGAAVHNVSVYQGMK